MSGARHFQSALHLDCGAFAKPKRSGGQYIEVPNGATTTENDKATYSFQVTTSGYYRIKGWVYTADGEDDTFYIKRTRSSSR